jgi:hypothetical protein
LVLILATFTSGWWLGILGFLVMLACLLVIERNVRMLGRAGLENLTGQLGGGALKGAFGNAGRRWRERWQRDDGA